MLPCLRLQVKVQGMVSAWESKEFYRRRMVNRLQLAEVFYFQNPAEEAC